MRYAILESDKIKKVFDIDFDSATMQCVNCDNVQVYEGDTYVDGTFYHNGKIIPTNDEIAQLALEEANSKISAMYTAAQVLEDNIAVLVPELFQEWNGDGEQRIVGDKVRYEGNIYKCLQEHITQSDWNPKDAPSLWAKLLPGQEDAEIGEWQQPDSTNPYMTGDKVEHAGKTWVCNCDNNVWEPGIYGWVEV